MFAFAHGALARRRSDQDQLLAAALRNSELQETSIAGDVCCNDWLALAFARCLARLDD